MFENLNHTLYTFFISMLPIVELRGAIPVGCGFGLPFWENYLVCTIGNLLPVPFILLFIRFILNWMKGVPHLSKIANWVEIKAHKHSASIVKYAGWGLFIFVAIPPVPSEEPAPPAIAFISSVISGTTGISSASSYL